MSHRSCRAARGLSALFVIVSCGVATPEAGAAATADASSGNWWYKTDTGSDSVWFGILRWASTASIKWTVPTFTADATPLPTAPVPFSEPKFTVPATGFPTARIWTGYNISGTGPLGSTVNSVGSGGSNVGLAFYGANWNVGAYGTGTYAVKAVASDPWNIYPADFSSASGSTYSLYLPFSMRGGSSDPLNNASGFGFDVAYTTSGGTADLLNVMISGGTAAVTPATGLGSSLQFYLEPDDTTSPSGMSTTPGTLLSASQLATLVQGDLSPGGSLIAPINLGIVLNGIPIPTGLLSDGSVASISETISAWDAGTVPEPSSLALAALGSLVLLGGRRFLGARPAAPGGPPSIRAPGDRP